MSPWENWEQEHPEKKSMKEKDPVYLYKTFAPESNSVKESSNELDFLTFDEFVTESKKVKEDNMVALAGSSQDNPPMSKPFVLKTKKRLGGNEDEEEDDTEEVANVNTVGLGGR